MRVSSFKGPTRVRNEFGAFVSVHVAQNMRRTLINPIKLKSEFQLRILPRERLEGVLSKSNVCEGLCICASHSNGCGTVVSIHVAETVNKTI